MYSDRVRTISDPSTLKPHHRPKRRDMKSFFGNRRFFTTSVTMVFLQYRLAYPVSSQCYLTLHTHNGVRRENIENQASYFFQQKIIGDSSRPSSGTSRQPVEGC